MRCCAIIVAAGQGRRLGGAVPKPYQLLGGEPLLLWSLRALERSASCEGIVVVAARDRLEAASALLASARPHKLRAICAGGAERVDSVRAGLAALGEDTELVAIHDAARPLLAPALVDRLVAAADEAGAAIPVLPVRDTLRRGEDGLARGTLDRRALHLTQTPQVFRLALIREAYARLADRPATAGPVTDDAQLLEEAGVPVRLVEGDPLSFKVTDAADLALAERLIAPAGAAQPRSGIGYDVHRLVQGRPLVLGGVALDHPAGLLGHSDADVLCHAVADALLGAAALGDLGSHFPPDEERWRGAHSLDLLARVREKVAALGLEVASVDAMLICEAPRIAPHAARMRENLARALRAPLARVSVKAGTNERLGFVGRGEGIACLALALLSPSAEPNAAARVLSYER